MGKASCSFLFALLLCGCASTTTDDDAGDPGGHRATAKKLIASGNLDAAASELERAVELRPANSWTALELAQVLHQQGRIDEARALLRKSLAVNPKIGALYFSLANLERNQGNNEEAARLYRETLKYLPSYTEARVYLAVILREQGDLQAAVQLLGAALAGDESNLTVNFELAKTLDLAADWRAREQWDYVARICQKKQGPEEWLKLARARLRALPFHVSREGVRYLMDGAREVLRAKFLPEKPSMPPEHLVPEGLLSIYDNPVFLTIYLPESDPVRVWAVGDSLLEAVLEATYLLRREAAYPSWLPRLDLDLTVALHIAQGELTPLDLHIEGDQLSSQQALGSDEGLLLSRDGEPLAAWLPGDDLRHGSLSLEEILAVLSQQAAGTSDLWRRPGVEVSRFRTRSWIDGPAAGDLNRLVGGRPEIMSPTSLEIKQSLKRLGNFLVGLRQREPRLPGAYDFVTDAVNPVPDSSLQRAAAAYALAVIGELLSPNLFLPAAFEALDGLKQERREADGRMWIPAAPRRSVVDRASLAATAFYLLASARLGRECEAGLVREISRRLNEDGSFLLPPYQKRDELEVDLDALLRYVLCSDALRKGDSSLLKRTLAGFEVRDRAPTPFLSQLLLMLTRSGSASWRKKAEEILPSSAPSDPFQAAAYLILERCLDGESDEREQQRRQAKKLLLAQLVDGPSAYPCRLPIVALGGCRDFNNPREYRGLSALLVALALEGEWEE